MQGRRRGEYICTCGILFVPSKTRQDTSLGDTNGLTCKHAINAVCTYVCTPLRRTDNIVRCYQVLIYYYVMLK